MKRFIIIVCLLLLPFTASAQLTTQQGGTGSTSPSGILYGIVGNLHLQTVSIGSGLQFLAGVLSATGGGGSSSFSTTSLSAVAPLQYSQSPLAQFSITQSGTGTNGYLSSTDFNTFNNKVSSTSLSVTTTGTSGAATYTPSTGVFNIPQYQAGGNYITALTGDVTASGPGSVAATLATVNSNVGSFTNASITVNGKGLITAASNGTTPEVPLTFTWPLIRTTNTISFGGLTTSTAAVLGHIPYFSGVNTFANVATTTLVQGTNITFSGGTPVVIGSSPITINASGGGSPGGSNTQVQFNDSGSFGGDSAFLWDKTANILTLPTLRAPSGSDLLVENNSGSAALQLADDGNDAIIFTNGSFLDLTDTNATLAGVNTGDLIINSFNNASIFANTTVSFGTINSHVNIDDAGSLELQASAAGTGLIALRNGSSGFSANLDTSLLSSDRTFTFPDETGTFALGTGSAGNCASWSTTNTLTTTGSPCGAGGGGGVGTVSTSSLETAGQLPYWTTTNGYPAKLGSIATGTISAGSSAITVTAGRAAIGGALAIDCATAGAGQNGCLSSGNWTTFNNKIDWGAATSTSANQSVYTNALGKLVSVATSSVTVSTGLSYSGTMGAVLGGISGNLTVAGLTGTQFANVSANTVFGNATGASAAPTFFATSSLFAGTTGQAAWFSGSGLLTGTSSLVFTNATSTFLSDILIKKTSPSLFTLKDGFGTDLFNFNSASTTGSIFTVAATTSPNLTSGIIKLFDVDQYGHQMASSTGATPTVSTCGTGSGTLSAGSNDVTGIVTTATAATACTITFAHLYATTPNVVVSGASLVGFPAVTAVSTSAFTIGVSAAVTGDAITYIVVQP